MEYRDWLPAECPSEDAEEITTATELYRVVRVSPPTAEDFKSHKALRPLKKYEKGMCKACGLSVARTHSDCVLMSKLPTLVGGLICRIRVNAGGGKIQQNGQPIHHTWWPHRGFDHTTTCTVVAE